MKSFFMLLIVLALCAPASAQSFVETGRTGTTGIQRVADSVAAGMTSTPNQQTRKIKIIKKDIPYKTFVAIAVGMMAFIALIMTKPQTYNPSE
jgi:hypothetical protein